MIFAHEQDQILSACETARTAAYRQFQAQPARRLFEVEGRYPGRNDARVRRHRRERLSLRLFEHEIPAAQLRRGDRRSERVRAGRVPRTPEIGRAACRERVCQYVKISGVAVSLKKNNTSL